MATIPPAGNKFDFYAVNGVANLAVIPGGTHKAQPADAPIRLQRGDPGWGAIHIAQKHDHWLAKNSMEVHEIVWTKLQQQGGIYSTEEEDKFKISLRLSPSALLILRLIPRSLPFFTVVSIYLHPSELDGEHIGKYFGSGTTGPVPALCLPAPPQPPKITYKRKLVR